MTFCDHSRTSDLLHCNTDWLDQRVTAEKTQAWTMPRPRSQNQATPRRALGLLPATSDSALSQNALLLPCPVCANCSYPRQHLLGWSWLLRPGRQSSAKGWRGSLGRETAGRGRAAKSEKQQKEEKVIRS